MKITDFIYAKTGVSLDLSSLADDPEEQALVASLLALVARSDGEISPDETVRIVALLQDRFHLGPEEAVSLVNRAANEFGASADLQGVIANVNEELSLPHKEELLAIVLHVISADERKDAAEMQLLTTLVRGLEVPDNIMEKVYAQYFQDRKSQA